LPPLASLLRFCDPGISDPLRQTYPGGRGPVGRLGRRGLVDAAGPRAGVVDAGVVPPPVARVTTRAPSAREPPAISVKLPSVAPGATVTGVIVLSADTHTVRAGPRAAAAVLLIPYCSSRSADGLNRSAAACTRSTSSRRATSMLAVAVIPGFSFSDVLGASIIPA